MSSYSLDPADGHWFLFPPLALNPSPSQLYDAATYNPSNPSSNPSNNQSNNQSNNLAPPVQHLSSTASPDLASDPSPDSSNKQSINQSIIEPTLTYRPYVKLLVNTERLYLASWIRVIQRAGSALTLPNSTIVHASVFFHRFFADQPIQQHCSLLVAMACLLLAAKVQETGRRARDVINIVYLQARLNPNCRLIEDLMIEGNEDEVAWGFDYLKYDNCDNQGIKSQLRYQPMSDALNATGRPMVFSVCDWQDKAATWAPVLGNSWRTWDDIRAQFDIVMRNVMVNDEWWSVAGPGQFNDPDMIEVGNGMTYDEDVSHFSLWCLIKAPLILGNDIRSMSKDVLDIVTNDELIAINQDPLGIQGHRVKIVDDVLDVWAGPISGGTIAVVLLNRGNVTSDITVNWADIGLPVNAKSTVRDLWQHKTLGQFAGNFTAKQVRTHASVTLAITPPKHIVLAAF